MNDLTTCDYTKVIQYYKSLNRKDIDAEITKVRIEYLYNLYNLCSDEVRNKFIKRVEDILSSRFDISICLKRNIDKIIEYGKDKLLNNNNKRLLGECLPIILTLEKELRSILNDKYENNDDLEEWSTIYLNKYDDRFKMNQRDYDIYDIFNTYAKMGMRKYKFKMCVYGVKIAATLSGAKEK